MLLSIILFCLVFLILVTEDFLFKKATVIPHVSIIQLSASGPSFLIHSLLNRHLSCLHAIVTIITNQRARYYRLEANQHVD